MSREMDGGWLVVAENLVYHVFCRVYFVHGDLDLGFLHRFSDPAVLFLVLEGWIRCSCTTFEFVEGYVGRTGEHKHEVISDLISIPHIYL